MKKILFLISILFSLVGVGQSNVELQIILLESDLVSKAALNQDEFVNWVQKINTEIENHYKEDTEDKEIMLLISLFKDKDPVIEIGSKPELDKSNNKLLLERIATCGTQKSKNVDYALAIGVKVNKGCSKEMDFMPKILFPGEKDYMEFEELSLVEKKISLQNWVNEQVIPLIEYYEINVDEAFQGVYGVGKIIAQKTYLNKDVEALTSQNSTYWRGVLEMEGGNQLIPFTKACMHIVNGEFDKAKSLLFLIGFFSSEGTLPDMYATPINSKLEIIDKELKVQINEGIALHDQGKYKKAVKHYKALLKDFPKSAWLRYELYFSETADLSSDDELIEEWKKAKEVIYANDPMYYMDVRATNGKEAYLLFKRQEIATLFKSQENLKSDFVKYADIALDLGNYGVAAQVYWLVFSYFEKEIYDNRNILAHFLYCLDKLGDTSLKENFEGDFPAEFEKIDEEKNSNYEG